MSLLAYLMPIMLAMQRLSAASDCNNPLLDPTYNQFAPSAHLTVPTAITGLSICGNQYNDKKICCSSSQIDQMTTYFTQKKLDLLVNVKNDNQVLSDALMDAVKNKNRIILAFYSGQQYLALAQQQFAAYQSVVNTGIDSLQQAIKQQTDLGQSFLPSTFDTSIFPNAIKGLIDDQLGQTKIDDISVQLQNTKDLIYKLSNASNDNFALTKNYSIDVNNTAVQVNSSLFQALSQDQISSAILDSQDRMRKLMVAKGTCFSALLQHQAGLICGACSPNYTAMGISLVPNPSNPSQKLLEVIFPKSMCTQMQQNCFDYINATVEINKNAVFTANAKSMQFLSVQDLLNINETNLTAGVDYFNKRTSSYSDLMKQMKLYQMPTNCFNTTDCLYICQNFLSEQGFGVNTVIDGFQLDTQTELDQQVNFFQYLPQSYQNYISDVNYTEYINLLGLNRRNLQTTNIPYNSTLFQANFYSQSSSDFNTSHALFTDNYTASFIDTASYGVTSNLSTYFNGTGDLDIFNASGNLNQSDYVENIIMPAGIGVYSSLPLQNDTTIATQLVDLAGSITQSTNYSAPSVTQYNTQDETNQVITLNKGNCITVQGQTVCNLAKQITFRIQIIVLLLLIGYCRFI